MPEPHDPNSTRPLVSARVLYRCTCGCDFQVALEIGGECPRCERFVSPKVLQHEMAISTICDSNFELHSSPGLDPFGFLPSHSSAESNANTEGQRNRRNQPDPEWKISDSAQKETVGSRQDFSAQEEPNDSQPIKAPEPGEDTLKSDTADRMGGRRYGHFELVAPLGRGGMGQVYRALDTSLQRYVAVKLLKSGIPQLQHDPTQKTQSPLHEIDKLLQEAITQARVAHPNIVTIYYVGKEAGNPFLAMELVNGEPLNSHIAKGPMLFSSLVAIAAQIADALRFSYELDLIHGDIKPSNILIQQDGVAKLSDFGMARNVSRDTNEAIGGTLNYLAPEILRGNKPSVRSDIYALGVTLYEMTFGQLPIRLSGENIADWVSVHQFSQVNFPDPWPDHLPEAWRDILTRMLAKAPEDRYCGYDDLLSELNRIKPHAQVTARPFPRLVAAGIDWISILALAIVLRIILAPYSLSPMAWNLLRVADFLPMGIYLMIIYFFRQSFGRSLMHIRVVNKHGHRLKTSRMLARTLVRMQFPWITVAWLAFLNFENRVLDISLSVLMILSGIFLIADLSLMIFNRQRQSIHDQIFGTKVVIDIDGNS
jgi:eukaryotic-like serine/threonine-protein kinase